MSETDETFNIAPVPIWIEDYSEVRTLLDQWRSNGVADLRAWLVADLTRVAECARRIKVVHVNAATLSLYEARDQDHLIENLDRVFRDDMLGNLLEELCQLWAGNSGFQSAAVNYTLSGKRLDIQLKAAAFPGHETDLGRVLVVTEDVTARENARRAELQSRLDAEALFRHSPVSLWIEDFSGIKKTLDRLRQQGISDLRTFTDVNPQFVRQCMQQIVVRDVNTATLELFQAASVQTLLSRTEDIFRGEMERHFREQLIELWNGNLWHEREVVNYALDGTERAVIMRFSVVPGHEQDWSRALIAVTDITARKRAEAYLSYLGKHDVLTGLHNRAHFLETISQYMRQGIREMSLIAVDLDGLKEANDKFGHAAGDALLQRAGEVFRELVVGTQADASRVGGDEFVVLLPYEGEAGTQARIAELRSLIGLNNKFHAPRLLSLSIGCATLLPGESQESLIRRADDNMYEDKRQRRAERA